ncbi:hypothetical protein ACROYT_G029101 [Oculina patagonica]
MLQVKKLLMFLAPSLLFVTSSHPGEWSNWSACSTTCDEGIRVRNRTCESCNTTLQTQNCNDKPCQDIQTQIIMVVVVTIAVISIVTAVLVVIFFVKGTKSRKPRASSLDTSKRLRTMTLEKTNNLTAGICVENRVFQLQRMAESRGSLQTSRTTLKDFGEPQLRVNAQM